MDIIQKNDFIEIDYTGIVDGNIFDTTDKKKISSSEKSDEEKAKKLQLEADIKPMIVSVGNGMLLKGLDNSLEGKEIGKKYSIHLNPEEAFGKRNPGLVQTYPLASFKKNNINPYPGLTLVLDNNIARVIIVNSGRVIVDFNNPLAGKEIDYNYTIRRKITEDNEKVNALQDYFFKQRFEFTIKDNKVLFKDEKIMFDLGLLKDKFKDMTGMEFEVEKEKEEIVKLLSNP